MNKVSAAVTAVNPFPRLRSCGRRLRRTEAGQSLVEFAMVLPIFLVLIFALVDFGRAFYTWLLVTNAAREGARAAAVQLDSSAIDNRVYQSVCKAYPGDCAIEPGKITITKQNVQGTRGTATTVNVSYAFSYATPLGSMISKMPGASGANLATPMISGYSSMRLE